MVSKLTKCNGWYYCNNCKMKQPRLQDTCWWCGDIFSNFEDMLYKDFKETSEAAYYESNIYRAD